MLFHCAEYGRRASVRATPLCLLTVPNGSKGVKDISQGHNILDFCNGRRPPSQGCCPPSSNLYTLAHDVHGAPRTSCINPYISLLGHRCCTMWLRNLAAHSKSPRGRKPATRTLKSLNSHTVNRCRTHNGLDHPVHHQMSKRHQRSLCLTLRQSITLSNGISGPFTSHLTGFFNDIMLA